MSKRKKERSATKKPELKRFIVRKYVMARSADEALRLSRKYKPCEVFIDSDWAKEGSRQFESAIGFTIDTENDHWDR